MDAPFERRVEPSSWLRPWVSAFRLISTSPGQSAHLVQLPDGAAALLFRETGDGTGDWTAIGPLRRARYKTTLTARFYVRVCLHPGRARRLLGLPLDAIADQIVPLEALCNCSNNKLCERLLDGGPSRAVPVVEGVTTFHRNV